MGVITPPGDGNTPLTVDQRARWNKFQDFVAANKMAGSPILDQRNKQIGMGLLQKFNMQNPESSLPLDVVPRVQQDLQDYRTDLVNKWKAGKVAPIEGVKTEADIMSNLSPVDGWPGSKTLSSRYPVAMLTGSDGSKKDFGVNIEGYNQAAGVK